MAPVMGTLSLPMTPTMGHHSSYWHQTRGSIPPTDTNDAPLSSDTNGGGLLAWKLDATHSFLLTSPWHIITLTDSNNRALFPSTVTTHRALFHPMTPLTGQYFFQWQSTIPYPDTNKRPLFLSNTIRMRHSSSHRHQSRGIIPPIDINDGTQFLPLTPPMEHYSSYWQQLWGTVPAIDTNEGELFLPLRPKMEHCLFNYHRGWGIIPLLATDARLFFCYSWPQTLGHFLFLLPTEEWWLFTPIDHWCQGIFFPHLSPPPKVWRTVGEHGSGLNSWREVGHVIHLGNLCHHGVERWRRQKNGQVVSIVGLLFLGGGVWLSGLLS